MNQFYNPYQFIPVTGEINGNKERTAYADVAAGRHAHARHDLWQKNGASGRILCSLRLHTPTIVGARQTGQPPKRVAGYSWRGKHAIPGNSLKGMIGSIAEALSQSTLRVLDKHEEVPKTRPPKRWTVGLPVQGQNRPVPHPVKVDTHRYFARIDQDMVPWRRSSGQTQRDRLTPAELLFGLVEDIESGVSNDPGRNLAGRVRFHDALPLTGDGETDPEITLKILASPYLTGDKKAGKQCVPFYFHKRGQRGGYIGKRAFYQAEHNDDILPNGRKFYLQHHRPAFPGHSDWAAALCSRDLYPAPALANLLASRGQSAIAGFRRCAARGLCRRSRRIAGGRRHRQARPLRRQEPHRPANPGHSQHPRRSDQTRPRCPCAHAIRADAG
jgi:hypothetical protein